MFIEDYAKIASRVGPCNRAVLKFGQFCCLSPIRRNSVFEVLKVSRFAVIQKEICCRALRKRVMLASRSEGYKEKKS